METDFVLAVDTCGAVVIVAFIVTVWLLAIASSAKPGTDRANARLDAVPIAGTEVALFRSNRGSRSLPAQSAGDP